MSTGLAGLRGLVNTNLGSVLLESSFLPGSSRLRDFLLVACSIALDISDTQAGGIWIVCGHYLRRCVVVNLPESMVEGLTLELGKGPAGEAALKGIPVASNDMLNDDRVVHQDVVSESGLRGFLAVPLSLGPETIGVLTVGTKTRPRRFAKNDISLLQRYCDVLALGIDHCIRRPEMAQYWVGLLSRWRGLLLEVRRSRDGMSALPVSSFYHPPKTIHPTTLKRIYDHIAANRDPVDADSVSRSLGLSPATARRYLTYMVRTGIASADLQYGPIGRPKHRYVVTP